VCGHLFVMVSYITGSTFWESFVCAFLDYAPFLLPSLVGGMS
jgi:hypothetical protein